MGQEAELPAHVEEPRVWTEVLAVTNASPGWDEPRAGAVGSECHREGVVCVCVCCVCGGREAGTTCVAAIRLPALEGKTEESQARGEKSKRQNLMTLI